jgi:hypothetical protein
MANSGRHIVKNLAAIRDNPGTPVFTDKSVISKAASVTGLSVRRIPHTCQSTVGLARRRVSERKYAAIEMNAISINRD